VPDQTTPAPRNAAAYTEEEKRLMATIVQEMTTAVIEQGEGGITSLVEQGVRSPLAVVCMSQSLLLACVALLHKRGGLTMPQVRDSVVEVLDAMSAVDSSPVPAGEA
jgi:hypothetical protein